MKEPKYLERHNLFTVNDPIGILNEPCDIKHISWLPTSTGTGPGLMFGMYVQKT